MRNENCALLGHYAASIDKKKLPTIIPADMERLYIHYEVQQILNVFI